MYQTVYQPLPSIGRGLTHYLAINGIPVAIKMAELAVKLQHLTGLRVSRVSDYQPPADIIAEFIAHPKGL
ncbi:hypothetical protein [Bradyrhizobium sp. URHC0002]